MVGALVWLSALPLLAVSLLPLLVRGCVGRCVWLSLPGLPRAASGVAWLLLFLLLSLRPCLPWLLPLLVVLWWWLLSVPRRPRPLRSRLLLRPASLGRGWAPPPPGMVGGEALPGMLGLFFVMLSRWRRSGGPASRVRPR